MHNESDKLDSVLAQITLEIESDDHIVFCGDLVDRGREATRTIESLVQLCRKYPDQVFFIEGNHDWMLRNYLQTGNTGWLTYLAITLNDFKDHWNLSDTMPATIANALLANGYKEITSRTVPYYETPELIATHAPLDWTVTVMNGSVRYDEEFPIKSQQSGFKYLLDRMRDELLWQFTDEQGDPIPGVNKYLVCGHQAGNTNSPRIRSDRAFIDTGCGLKPYRKLTCLVYPSKKVIQNK